MSFDTQRWRIHITNLEANIKIGIYDHEKAPQRVLVSVVVEGIYPAAPAGIEECFNYDSVHKLVTQEWPKWPHVDLLETCVTGLLTFIFRSDSRVDFARACVSKPDIFSDAESVGVEAQWTRADFERLVLKKP